jgi:hypothetical protein
MYVRYPIVNDWACTRSSTRRWRSTIGRLTGGPAQRKVSCVAQTVNLLPGSGLPAGTPEGSVVNVQTVAHGAQHECLSTFERIIAAHSGPCKGALKQAKAGRFLACSGEAYQALLSKLTMMHLLYEHWHTWGPRLGLAPEALTELETLWEAILQQQNDRMGELLTVYQRLGKASGSP